MQNNGYFEILCSAGLVKCLQYKYVLADIHFHHESVSVKFKMLILPLGYFTAYTLEIHVTIFICAAMSPTSTDLSLISTSVCRRGELISKCQTPHEPPNRKQKAVMQYHWL